MQEPDEVLAENRRLKADNQQRAAELAIVNSVQQALAAARDELGPDFQITPLGEEMFTGKSELVRVFAVDG